VPRPRLKEYGADVVAVARMGEPPLSQIAKVFGLSESCLRNWLQRADIYDGHRPGPTSVESAELRELKRRNRLLEQENEVLRRAAAYLPPGEPAGENDVLARPWAGRPWDRHDGEVPGLEAPYAIRSLSTGRTDAELIPAGTGRLGYDGAVG
jgi:transposase